MEGQDPRSLQTAPLDAVPLSWLHQLVSTLPARERLALFQTCRSLSRQVVQTSPSVSLCLLDQGLSEQAAAAPEVRTCHAQGQSEQAAAAPAMHTTPAQGQVEDATAVPVVGRSHGQCWSEGVAVPSQCRIITQLLDSCSGFRLRLVSYPHPLMPVAHLQRITVLEIDGGPRCLQCDLSQPPAVATARNDLTQPHTCSATLQSRLTQQAGPSVAQLQQALMSGDTGTKQQPISSARMDTNSTGEMAEVRTGAIVRDRTGQMDIISTAQKGTGGSHAEQMITPSQQHGISAQETSTAEAEIPWSAMTRLQSLSLPGSIGPAAISSLCTALEAGQLQRLNSFTFVHSTSCIPPEVIQRVTRALGPRLTHLHTDSEGLLMHLSCMRALKSICIECDKCKVAVAKQLCEHPTLCSVDLQGCFAVEGNHSLSGCRWEVLSINTHNPHVLNVLPLAGLHEIRFVGLARCSNEYYRQAIHTVLQQYRDKIVCVPKVTYTSIRCLYEPVFEFWGVHEESVQLAGCLTGVSTVHVCGIVARPSMLRKLWEALPAHVHAVGLFDVFGVNWDHVWDGMPQTVTHVDMTSLPWAAMCNLVRTCPKHVTSMAVAVKRLDSALLHSLAPAHVDLKFG